MSDSDSVPDPLAPPPAHRRLLAWTATALLGVFAGLVHSAVVALPADVMRAFAGVLLVVALVLNAIVYGAPRAAARADGPLPAAMLERALHMIASVALFVATVLPRS